MLPARNIELKARVTSLDGARVVAQRLATGRGGTLVQTDTYFHVAAGRLKLREIAGAEAQLIGYERPDVARAKESRYRIYPAPNAPALLALLTDTLGVRVVVEKRRELYFYENVRLHLDTVTGLGTFLEFEAVCDAASDRAAEERKLVFLGREFGISNSDIEPRSYADLLSPPARKSEG